MNEEQDLKVENNDSITPVENNEVDEEKPSSNEVVKPVSEKTFSQQEVNDIVRDRINRVYNRYGLKDSKEMDKLVGKSQAYEVMKKRYAEKKNQIAELMEKVAFMENDIEPTRYDDIRAYFKGKGIKFDNETLVNELATHPEWKRLIENSTAPITTIQSISPDRASSKDYSNERDEVAKMFGFKNGFVRR